MWVPEALIIIIPICLMIGFLLLAARREDLMKQGTDRDKATARMILLIPIWPLWVIYHVVRVLVVGFWWLCKNAFKEDK